MGKHTSFIAIDAGRDVTCSPADAARQQEMLTIIGRILPLFCRHTFHAKTRKTEEKRA